MIGIVLTVIIAALIIHTNKQSAWYFYFSYNVKEHVL